MHEVARVDLRDIEKIFLENKMIKIVTKERMYKIYFNIFAKEERDDIILYFYNMKKRMESV
ncbi:hypothetical protein CH375_21080 [Leptospira ellisii]|uniref:Uncharacterized protein n=1 Tax=Leptospira ellisii TaxID=2023197 RepID=A0A2N0BFI0_9LEPT|nr:hypothetical protein CH379_05020 [Leptospira ellisii]PKA02752.1 hypothetical protein CH375_21080 [Leptospira ellisii]